ncbi:MAG: ParB/RepB/Spo0J family partition protein [Betaproteobacteria bacterium]|nr:ParB/RepB/Spo0J family partition protein [Betaproteobacteria bacterium]
MNPIEPCTAPLDFGQDELSRTEILEISLKAIRPDPGQPRRYFDEEALAELRDSMALYGLLQPVGVRQTADGGWELIFGERRYRAAISLGWKTIPARVFPVEARRIKTVLQLGENAHRADLSLLEYLGGIEQLRDLGVSAGAMARMLCKSDEWVAAMMDISREPLARSLYEAGIMTQVGAWEAFCRLPEHLRHGLLQSGEQLTIQRCKKVLDAHEAQMSARQQGLLESAAPQTSCPMPVLPGHDTSEETAQDSAAINDFLQGPERSSECGEHLVVPLWIPLDLANAILPARAREFREIAEWVSGQREFSEEIRVQAESAEAALVAAISALVGVVS